VDKELASAPLSCQGAHGLSCELLRKGKSRQQQTSLSRMLRAWWGAQQDKWVHFNVRLIQILQL